MLFVTSLAYHSISVSLIGSTNYQVTSSIKSLNSVTEENSNENWWMNGNYCKNHTYEWLCQIPGEITYLGLFWTLLKKIPLGHISARNSIERENIDNINGQRDDDALRLTIQLGKFKGKKKPLRIQTVI